MIDRYKTLNGSPDVREFVKMLLFVLKTLDINEVVIPEDVMMTTEGTIAVFKDKTNGSVLIKVLDTEEVDNLNRIIQEENNADKWSTN